jgi:BirA family transcriptional regulator, biotin operon repressor / biotin---[acetyl-CoA-carboxylase] ligase
VIRAFLDEEAISTHLASNYWRVRVLSEVTSTQEILKTELVSNGDCVVAEFQSAGRGRLDRKFDSAPHVALLFSFFIEPKRVDAWGWIPLIAGTAVARTLNEQSQTNSFLTKWPNDVLASSGKVSGVLCERYRDGIIVGIGINVSTQVDELPVDTASSVFIETGLELDRNSLLPVLLIEFQELFERWDRGEDLTPTYRALSKTIGLEVRVIAPDASERTGVAIGVDIEGRLKLEGGELVSVGDVVHLR